MNGKETADGQVEDEFINYDGIGLASLVKSGQVTPLELLEIFFRRVELINPGLNVLASHDFDFSRKVAASLPKGIFEGVPFLVKDVLPYPGLEFSMGSRLFKGYITNETTPYSERIKGSGLIPFGKTTTSEFGLLGSTETMLSGITVNPFNHEYSATGSSGGSAAAVASGIVPLAHASDAGGSIRIPASACGVFGFKPSEKRCVQASNNNNLFSDLITNHCITRSVRDSAAFLSVTERKGKDAVFTPVGFIRKPLDRSLKIGFYIRTLMGEQPDSEVLDSLESTIKLCMELGHKVIETRGPCLDGQAISDAFFIAGASVISDVAHMMEKTLGTSIDGRVLEPFTLSLIQWYRSLPPNMKEGRSEIFTKAKDSMLKFSKNFDVILCPTSALPVPSLGYLSPNLDRELLIKRTERFAGYTPIHNIAGMPAMSVPLFFGRNGMPIGSHFATQPGDDEILLRLAYQLEDAAPWSGSLPKCN